MYCVACTAVARRPPASRPAPRPASYAPRFDLVEGVGVQPAGELRHVRGQRHELHVFGATNSCPAPDLHSGPSLHATCATAALPSSRLPPPGPHLAPLRMPSFRIGRVRRRSTSR
eukprot:scaffold54446_cov43-Phaeocystis_antarctica.AAC.1